MRNVLFALIVLIVASCSTLPKMEPENPECRSVFQIRPLGLNWYDIRTIKDQGRVNTNMFPSWWDKGKGFLDGCNTILFHLGSRSFVGFKYQCFDFPYTTDLKKADMIVYKKYCSDAQYEILKRSWYDYEYSMPQNLIQELDYEGPLSFSAYEKVISVPLDSKDKLDRLVDSWVNPRPNYYKFSIFGDYNRGKASFLQISILGGSEATLKSIVESISFPKQ